MISIGTGVQYDSEKIGFLENLETALERTLFCHPFPHHQQSAIRQAGPNRRVGKGEEGRGGESTMIQSNNVVSCVIRVGSRADCSLPGQNGPPQVTFDQQNFLGTVVGAHQ